MSDILTTRVSKDAVTFSAATEKAIQWMAIRFKGQTEVTHKLHQGARAFRLAAKAAGLTISVSS